MFLEDIRDSSACNFRPRRFCKGEHSRAGAAERHSKQTWRVERKKKEADKRSADARGKERKAARKK